MILDSGNRREFDTGAVRDIQEGKGRCDLLPLAVVSGVYKRAGCDKEAIILVLIENFKTSGDYLFLVSALSHFTIDYYNGDRESLLLEVSIHFEEGAKKYGVDNWKKGIPTRCYIDSAVRHYLKYVRGDEDEPHGRAFVWNILCCIWTCVNKPDLNDYNEERS